MPKSICRDGFEFTRGRFVVERTDIEREDPDELRDLFLPRLTAAANRKLGNRHGYSRCQLKHYGIQYELSEYGDNGANLIKKMLRAGKMDKVPDHIETLRLQMSAEWHDQLTLEEMASSYPEHIFKKSFLDAEGRPDRTKTTKVLAVTIPGNSSFQKRKVLEAARKVRGLHYSEGFTTTGSSDTLYFGWTRLAVVDESNVHEQTMKRKNTQQADVRSQKRKSMHSDYLRGAQAKGNKACSPVGKYIVDCPEIENGFPENGDLTLDLCESGKPGIFEAHFYFGPIEGIMILSHEKSALDQHCLDLEKDSCYGDDDEGEDDGDGIENDSEEDEDHLAAGSKRKAARGGGGPPKKAKRSSALPLQFFMRMKGRETGEGQVMMGDAAEGIIKFDNSRYSKYARFTGVVDMEYVADNVTFIARRVCGTPHKNQGSWSSYSD
ncbi:hypothetical protein SLS62_001420 [Diatrype stigma]|uniref:Uncharacterized protein n=1 Tax=Diatrype stigma TaxID=117547 RepID=A0AAN9UYA3_9PEZI